MRALACAAGWRGSSAGGSGPGRRCRADGPDKGRPQAHPPRHAADHASRTHPEDRDIVSTQDILLAILCLAGAGIVVVWGVTLILTLYLLTSAGGGLIGGGKGAGIGGVHAQFRMLDA